MFQDDERALQDIVQNYSVREILLVLHKHYIREADELADMGYKERSSAYADISESLMALHDVCDPSW